MTETRALHIGIVAQQAVRRHGQGRVVLELTRALLARGHTVTLYVHRADPELEGVVSLRRLPRLPGPQIIDDIFVMAYATILTRRAHHDVCCVVGPTAIPPRPFAFNTQFSHRGWRMTWKDETAPSWKHRVHTRAAEALERLCTSRADRLIASTAALGQEMDPGATPVSVVPNGFDPAEFGPPSAAERSEARLRVGVAPDAFVVGFLGEYETNRKGLSPLLQAVAKGPAEEILLIAGPGPERKLRTDARRLGIEDRLTVVGMIPPRVALAACDAVAVPSLYEPFSLVAAEAAATGLPVVLSERAGVGPLLDGAAIVVDPTDSAAIRSALDQLRQDPEVAEALGRAGVATTASLTWSRAMEAGAAVLEELAGDERAAGRTARR